MAVDLSQIPEEERGPVLHCLGGLPCRIQLKRDIHRLTLLPNEALNHIYEVVGPLLGGELSNDRFRQVAGPFAEKHRVSMADLVPGVAAIRTLLRGAASEHLDIEKFVEDLEALAVEVPVAQSLARGYGQAVVMIRAELMMAALMDHGPVLKNVFWRLDQMRASNRGKEFNAPVLTLTFNYQEAGHDKQLSLQCLPQVLQQMRAIIDELLEDKTKQDSAEAPKPSSAD